jgi:HD-like signal output (HDOD) protein
MTDISAFFHTIRLPAMPEAAQALIRTLDREDASASRVRAIIEKDSALSATLLRMANSALFGLSQRVSSLDAAINLVGMSQIRNHAIMVCLRNTFPVAPGLDRQAFWQGCVSNAAYGHWLAGHAGLDPQTAWLSALLLRLGELILAQKDASAIEAIERLPCRPGERWAREKMLTGYDEGQISAELGRRWDFPPEMVQALDEASAPLQASELSRLAAVVHLAALMADSTAIGTRLLDALPADVLTALQLDLAGLEAGLPDVRGLLDMAGMD